MRQKVSGVRQEKERVPPQVWHRRPYICVGPATTEGRTNQRVLTPVQRGHIASLHLPRRNWTLPYTNCPDNTSYHPQREDTASLHLLRRNRTLPRTRCVLTPGAIQGGRTHCLAAPSTEELDPAPHQLSW
ncbi:uncharacterized protein LOC123509782 isoform X2 [Portunus trituberculatus]|uniref:uncharacterized protein LOC123509782 isoform X2 n=1 Tax=Portunus trituberculatus TaxID=210409 RepID=UPI001E1CC022|nr:uncharacterized protein LOC123509782 isoform X2 [Portunus trituberculatus]